MLKKIDLFWSDVLTSVYTYMCETLRPCSPVCYSYKYMYRCCQNDPKLLLAAYICFLTDVTVELFGSSVSGFALVSSNVNLNLNIPGAQERQVGVQ